jgi:peptidoglycan/xylan/chitin deacetylase (PgdA/CDA1 family)
MTTLPPLARRSIRDRIVYASKCAIASALYISGALDLYRRVAFRGRPVVLMYHRVLPRGWRARTWSHPGMVVERETFERQMRLLSTRFALVGIDDFAGRLASGQPFEPSSCLVTFDDGWIDTWTEAWPVLRRFQVPALVFLSVNYIGSTKTFWQEHLSGCLHRIWLRAAEDAAFRQRASDTLREYGLDAVLGASAAEVRQAIGSVVATFKRATQDRIDAASAAASALAEPSAGADSLPTIDGFISWSQVKTMTEGGISFGGHGATHAILTSLPLEAARQEILESERILRENVGAPVTAFSYPNGDWSAAVVEAVRDAGFSLAFATRRGDQRHPYAIPRTNIHEDMTSYLPLFYARVLGVL